MIPPFWNSPALHSLKGQRCRDVLPLASCATCVSKFNKLGIKIQWCWRILPFPLPTNHFIMFVRWQEHWTQEGTNQCAAQSAEATTKLLIAASLLPFTWQPPTHTSSTINLLLFRLFSSFTPTRTDCWEAAFLWQQGTRLRGEMEVWSTHYTDGHMCVCLSACGLMCVCVGVGVQEGGGGETDWLN